MSFPYVVVQFPKEGTYSEIPTSWLTKDCTQCRWPITKNASFFLKKNSPPEADWLLFDVKVECYCDTFEKARKKAENANYATSCDETRGRGKRVVHGKQFDDTYEICDDSANDDYDSPPQLCKTAHKKLKIDKDRDSSGKKSLCNKQFSHEKQSSCEKVSQIAAEKSFSTPNRSWYDTTSQTREVDPLQADEFNDINEPLAYEPKEINVQNLDFIPISQLATIGNIDEKLIPICVEILKYVKSIDKRLKTLGRDIINAEELNMNIFDDILPINSIQNLKKFEENMENVETKTNFVEFMNKIGGKGGKNLVQRCMSRLFTNEFGISCSWCGRGNNHRMCNLKCIRILKGILGAKGVDECDFETVASEWFRLSKLRYDRESKKILPDDRDAH